MLRSKSVIQPLIIATLQVDVLMSVFFFSTWQKVSFYTLILKRRFKWQIKYIVHEIKIPSH